VRLRHRYWIGLLVVVGLGWLARSAAAAPVPISEQAREHFRVGVALLQDPAGPRYEEAYRAFQAAYADSPSPKILGNLALCAMNLERDSEAIDAYQRYLAEVADIDAEERAQIERDLQVLRGSVVPIELAVAPPQATVIDERIPARGERVTNRYSAAQGRLAIGIRAGHHRIRVEHPGYHSATWELEAVYGTPLSKSITLSKLGEGEADPSMAAQPGALERPVPTGVYIGLASTAALGVAAGVLGGLSLANKGEFDDAIEAGETDRATELRETGIGLNIATDVLLGCTVAAAGVTAILYFTRPEVARAAAEPSADLRLEPLAGPSGGALRLSGAF